MLTSPLAAAKLMWRSPIYSFFKSDVVIKYINKCLVHFLPCMACHCKLKLGGVRRFQDKGDCASTANLKYHANRCFGEEAVKNALSAKEANAQSGSIFHAFAQQGQKLVNYSHRSHTNIEVW